MLLELLSQKLCQNKTAVSQYQQMRVLSPYEQTHISRYKPQLIEAVEAGEYGDSPVEYITSRVEFADMVLHVDKRVLIPRVETEDLVDRAWLSINRLYSNVKKIRVVEVGTGSGAIGLALWRRCALHQQSNMEFHLLDISPDALMVAQMNLRSVRQELIALQSLQNSVLKTRLPQIHIATSDLLQHWPSDQYISVLVANLPYIPSQRMKLLDSSVSDFEPHSALDGGSDGLLYIGPLLRQAQSVLEKNGVCWLEIDDSHTAKKILQTQESGSSWQCEDSTDCFGKMRFARCVLTKKRVKTHV